MTFFEPADTSALKTAFPDRPFGLRHSFRGNRLFTLPKIAELVKELPRDFIEYNSGRAAISQNPETVPTVDLDPGEIVRQIETAGAWMVLKNIETHPAYGALIDDALLEIARTLGHSDLRAAGFDDVRGFLFVSSAQSTTPFHADSDENFFFQLHGEKLFRVYDNRDRSIASERLLEDVVVKHRNIPYEEKFDAGCTLYHLLPGDGVFVPYQWPHWVRTADSYSISLSITWKSRDVSRRNDITTVNSMLRGIGMPQQPPGAIPALDTAKLALFRSVRGVIAPLRRSEAMRRVLRRVALGQGANYYYKKPGTSARRESVGAP